MAEPGPHEDLTQLLADLVNSVPHARSALLVSGDGILKYAYGLERDDAERLAASASGLCGLTHGIGQAFGQGDDVRHISLQVGDLALFLTAAGVGTSLVVLADPQVHAGTLSHNMVQLGKKVPTHLTTPARHDSVMPGSR